MVTLLSRNQQLINLEALKALKLKKKRGTAFALRTSSEKER
jgi:hypothetical protein